jgi:two-component system sensor histidine kinase KdpD
MQSNNDQRSDAAGKRTPRGKLRIYFGASAGVGKTYAMLLGAGMERAAGRRVLLAAIDNGGQGELTALETGFEVIRTTAQAGISGLDLDLILAGSPDVMVVDALAAANPAGARHPKRWQDVQELLDAGIDVFTTLNVQDLESLNDVIGDITGNRVTETVPDALFDHADQVILVDVPVDELLARFRTGKVAASSIADESGNAPEFLRKGHLIALRELALRRTAERVEDDVLAHRQQRAADAQGKAVPVWKTGAGLLACIGPHAGADAMIRSAARLANQLNTDWCAVYVETPALQRLPAARSECIMRDLNLAESLGATTVVLTGPDVAATIADYARSQNVSKVVCSHSRRNWRFPWNADLAERLADLAPDLDIIEIGTSGGDEAIPVTASGEKRDGRSTRAMSTAFGPTLKRNLPPEMRSRYAVAIGASLATALACLPLMAYLDLANIALLFLLTLVVVTVRLGRGPSLAATVVAIAAFDFLFVPPRFSFVIYDWQYAATFVVMLLIALITGKLTADLRYQAAIAAQRESRSRALYEFAGALSGSLQTEQIFDVTREFIQDTFCAKATLLLPNDAGRLQYPDSATHMSVLDMGIAQWAFDHAVAAGMGTDTLPAGGLFYLPLIAPMRTRGVLAIEPEDAGWILIPEQQKHLATFGRLAAIALERVHYVDVAQGALIRMESERLRNSLLSALSHDLRTPLTSLVGLSESLARSSPPMSEVQYELAEALRDEAIRMNHLVSNLLDMARIQSGQLRLNLQWQALEEVVGSALHASRVPLAGREVQLHLPGDLPLVSYDAVLIERVLCNLLENAIKYTPADATLTISAETAGSFLKIRVADTGPGLPPGQEEEIFEKFTRGEHESAKPGVGLGLSICRAIVEAHRGTIRAYNLDGSVVQGTNQSVTHGGAQEIEPSGRSSGACFEFLLPLGTPPGLPGGAEMDFAESDGAT